MNPHVFRLFIATILIAWAATHNLGAADIELSPGNWAPEDMAYYTALQTNSQREHPSALSRKGMVVGSTGALAIRSGVEALREGGSAMDAAAVTALTQIVLSAGATVSYAGKMVLVYYDAENGEVSTLNGAWNVPEGQRSGSGIPACDIPDGRQVLVHGFMAALEEAHERFGILPFEQLFEPAIYFAENGFEIDPTLGGFINYRLPVITRLEGGREIFIKEDGTPYGTGDWFRQPVLAETLRAISQQGASYMYEGPWADELIALVQQHGGTLDAEDLQAYQPTWLSPLTFQLGEHQVNAPPRPCLGGIHLFSAGLHLDPETMRASGHYTESADALSSLLSGIESAFGYNANLETGDHSDGVVAIDEAGNVAAMLHTINTNIWGGTGIFVDGISISDLGCWASRRISDAGPGGRIATVENPVIVTRGGVPIAATSAIGSGLFPATLFNLANLLIYHMDAQESVTSPSFLHPLFGYSGLTHRATVGDFSPPLLLELIDRGFNIQTVRRYSSTWLPGWCVVLTMDPQTGLRHGATVQDFNGIAIAQEERELLWTQSSRRDSPAFD